MIVKFYKRINPDYNENVVSNSPPPLRQALDPMIPPASERHQSATDNMRSGVAQRRRGEGI